uniref:Uncharacterized protein n=1 Tax=Phlebotomus papatasi TaxID=29031 RepID=A0A1B0DC42_PHLPP
MEGPRLFFKPTWIIPLLVVFLDFSMAKPVPILGAVTGLAGGATGGSLPNLDYLREMTSGLNFNPEDISEMLGGLGGGLFLLFVGAFTD